MTSRWAGTWVVMGVLSLAFVRAAEAEPPNVILIMSDDQGWGDVGFNGNEDIHTPHEPVVAGEEYRKKYAHFGQARQNLTGE